VVEVVPPGGDAIVIADVYDRHEGRDEANRSAQRAAWGEIAKHRRVIVAGDMNAHSKMWNPKATYNKNHTFWERLITEEDLFVWNTEEATRMGPGVMNHSIIDLTLSSPNMDLNWCLLVEEATGSDHEVIAWEVLGNSHPTAITSTETTGWNISGWDPAKESEEEEKKKAEERQRKARECYLAGAERTLILSDDSTKEEVREAAGSLREAMTVTLDEHARKKHWCSRSKPWWCEDLKELRKDLGRARRKWKVAGISRVKAVRREFRRAIRKAKRDCWNRFLQEADGNKVWRAAAYTTPRIDKTGQALVREDGSIAEGHHEREQAILQSHFPPGPPGVFEPAQGGKAFERIDAQLVGSLLGVAANTSASGDDRISAEIVKVYWQWDKQRITQLVRACIRLGFHPGIWKTAKGVVIPKPGKPDYSKVRAYRGHIALGRHQQATGTDSSPPDRGPFGAQAGPTRGPVQMPEAEILCRCGCNSDESHPISMGTEKDSRYAVHGCQVGVQQCRQNFLGEADGRTGTGGRPYPLDDELHVGPAGQTGTGR